MYNRHLLNWASYDCRLESREERWARKVLVIRKDTVMGALPYMSLILFLMTLFGVQWSHTTLFSNSVLGIIGLCIILNAFRVFRTARMVRIAAFVVGALSFFSFSYWSGPHLPVSSLGAFLFGLSIVPFLIQSFICSIQYDGLGSATKENLSAGSFPLLASLSFYFFALYGVKWQQLTIPSVIILVVILLCFLVDGCLFAMRKVRVASLFVLFITLFLAFSSWGIVSVPIKPQGAFMFGLAASFTALMFITDRVSGGCIT